jgi:hypothetical protein
VENCQDEMSSPPLIPVPPPLPPVPPSPRQQQWDAWQSSATLSGMRGQQREKCLSNDEDSCIAREVPDTCLAACRPDAHQPVLKEDRREIYYV